MNVRVIAALDALFLGILQYSSPRHSRTAGAAQLQHAYAAFLHGPRSVW